MRSEERTFRSGSASGAIKLTPILAYTILAVAISFLWPRYATLPGMGISIFGLFSLTAWLVFPAAIFISPKFRAQLVEAISGKGWLFFLAFAYMAWRIITSAIGDSPEYSLRIAFRDALYMFPILPCAMMLCAQRDGLRALFHVIVVSAAIAVSVCIVEQATHKTIVSILGLGVSGEAVFANEMAASVYRSGSLRAKSVFYHPIVFAQFLAWSAPMLWLAFRRNAGPGFRLAALVCLILTPYAVLASGSRAGIIAMVVSTASYVFLRLLQRARVTPAFGFSAIFAVFAAFLILMAPAQFIYSELIGGRDQEEVSSSIARSRMFSIGFENILRSPVTGYGDGMAAQYAGNLTGNSSFSTVDSLYLSTALNNGLVGLALLVSFFAATIILAVRSALGARREVDAAVAAGVLPMILTFAIVSLTDGLSFIFVSIAVISGGALSTRKRTPSSAKLGATTDV